MALIGFGLICPRCKLESPASAPLPELLSMHEGQNEAFLFDLDGLNRHTVAVGSKVTPRS
jgi:hypothetical protein